MLEERAAQWKDEYIRQGVMIGEARGIYLALQEFLKIRFGSLPQSVSSHIERLSDSDSLRDLTLFAYRAESLQSILEQLKKMTTK